MPPLILISILVFACILVGLLIFIANTMRNSRDEPITNGRESRPAGYWIGAGISIGVGFGVAMGIVFDNLALGIALGAGMGVAIGAALEQRNKDQVRPLTEQESKLQRIGVLAGLLILLVLTGIFALLFITRMR